MPKNMELKENEYPVDLDCKPLDADEDYNKSASDAGSTMSGRKKKFIKKKNRSLLPSEMEADVKKTRARRTSKKISDIASNLQMATSGLQSDMSPQIERIRRSFNSVLPTLNRVPPTNVDVNYDSDVIPPSQNTSDDDDEIPIGRYMKENVIPYKWDGSDDDVPLIHLCKSPMSLEETSQGVSKNDDRQSGEISHHFLRVRSSRSKILEKQSPRQMKLRLRTNSPRSIKYSKVSNRKNVVNILENGLDEDVESDHLVSDELKESENRNDFDGFKEENVLPFENIQELQSNCIRSTEKFDTEFQNIPKEAILVDEGIPAQVMLSVDEEIPASVMLSSIDVEIPVSMMSSVEETIPASSLVVSDIIQDTNILKQSVSNENNSGDAAIFLQQEISSERDLVAPVQSSAPLDSGFVVPVSEFCIDSLEKNIVSLNSSTQANKSTSSEELQETPKSKYRILSRGQIMLNRSQLVNSSRQEDARSTADMLQSPVSKVVAIGLTGKETNSALQTSNSASPSCGILRKRRLYAETLTDSPSPPSKQRRVCFSDKVETVEIPNCCLASQDGETSKKPQFSSPRPTGRFFIKGSPRYVSLVTKMDRMNGDDLQRRDPTQPKNAFDHTSQTEVLQNINDQIFQNLIDCIVPVEEILPRLTATPWIRGLKQLLHAKNIKTIGNLCALSEQEVNNLPISQPKMSRLRSALEQFAAQIVPKVSTKDQPSDEQPNMSPIQKSDDAQLNVVEDTAMETTMQSSIDDHVFDENEDVESACDISGITILKDDDATVDGQYDDITESYDVENQKSESSCLDRKNNNEKSDQFLRCDYQSMSRDKFERIEGLEESVERMEGVEQSVEGCEELKSVEGIEELKSVDICEELEESVEGIEGNEELKSDVEGSDELKSIERCEELKSVEGSEELKSDVEGIDELKSVERIDELEESDEGMEELESVGGSEELKSVEKSPPTHVSSSMLDVPIDSSVQIRDTVQDDKISPGLSVDVSCEGIVEFGLSTSTEDSDAVASPSSKPEVSNPSHESSILKSETVNVLPGNSNSFEKHVATCSENRRAKECLITPEMFSKLAEAMTVETLSELPIDSLIEVYRHFHTMHTAMAKFVESKLK